MIVIYVMLGIFTAANFVWTLHNRQLKIAANDDRNKAHKLLLNARKVAETNTAQYRLCPSCGKIVQGACLTCIKGVLANA